MATSNRRRVLVLALLGALCVLLYLTGVLGGDRRGAWTPGSGGGSFPGAARLTGDDLRVVQGTGCTLDHAPVTFMGACLYAVDKTAGLFPVTRLVRRAKLVVTSGPVVVTATVEGREITTTVDPGKSLAITMGKAGGQVALTCGAPLTGCSVVLTGNGP